MSSVARTTRIDAIVPKSKGLGATESEGFGLISPIDPGSTVDCVVRELAETNRPIAAPTARTRTKTPKSFELRASSFELSGILPTSRRPPSWRIETVAKLTSPEHQNATTFATVDPTLSARRGHCNRLREKKFWMGLNRGWRTQIRPETNRGHNESINKHVMPMACTHRPRRRLSRKGSMIRSVDPARLRGRGVGWPTTLGWSVDRGRIEYESPTRDGRDRPAWGFRRSMARRVGFEGLAVDVEDLDL